MKETNLKNIVILKNLPSNLVEEAIVVLKSNKNIRKLVKVEEYKNENKMSKKGIESNYVLKEAEMLVSDYLCRIENQDKQLKNRKNNSNKFKRLKAYSCIVSLIAFIETIILLRI